MQAPNIDYKGWMPFCLILEQCGAPSAEQIDGAHACNPRPPAVCSFSSAAPANPSGGVHTYILVLPPVLSLRATAAARNFSAAPRGLVQKTRPGAHLCCSPLGQRAFFPRWLSQVVMAQLFRSHPVTQLPCVRGERKVYTLEITLVIAVAHVSGLNSRGYVISI